MLKKGLAIYSLGPRLFLIGLHDEPKCCIMMQPGVQKMSKRDGFLKIFLLICSILVQSLILPFLDKSGPLCTV